MDNLRQTVRRYIESRQYQAAAHCLSLNLRRRPANLSRWLELARCLYLAQDVPGFLASMRKIRRLVDSLGRASCGLAERLKRLGVLEARLTAPALTLAAAATLAGCNGNSGQPLLAYSSPITDTVLIETAGPLVVDEEGGTATFTVRRKPGYETTASTIVFELVQEQYGDEVDASEISFSPSSVTFQADDPDQTVTVTVTVTGLPDGSADGDQSLLIRMRHPDVTTWLMYEQTTIPVTILDADDVADAVTWLR